MKIRATSPFLLHFTHQVECLPAPTSHYNHRTQCEDGPAFASGGTQRGRSYQNSTTSYGFITGYEDYDDEYVIERD